VTVIRDSADRYFASFVIEAEPGALPPAVPVTGIDLGLNHFAVLSDGRKISSPRFLRRAEKNLKRRQRNLSRKQKGSRNRDKARVKVARAHVRVADARRDFHHQLSTALIRENQAVAVEDLAVSGLAQRPGTTRRTCSGSTPTSRPRDEGSEGAEGAKPGRARDGAARGRSRR
jgi:putative transposase